MEAIQNADATIESRKIKIGKKEGSRNLPSRLKGIAITHTMKAKGGSNFERDNDAMKAIWNHYGVTKYDDYAEVPELPKLPVQLLSDDVFENIHVYRGWWSGGGPRCMSTLGEENARRFVEKRDSAFVKLDTPRDVPCNRDCQMWKENGEKSECGWKAIVSCQIEGMAIIPNLAKFRPNGWNSIQYIVGSANQIKKITGGILAGIPLDLVWREVEGRTKGDGKKRRYPVLVFEFPGTPQQLREEAIKEMESRRRLEAARSGKPVTELVQLTNTVSSSRISAPVGGDSMEEISSEDEEDDMLLIDDEDDDDAEALKAGDGKEAVNTKEDPHPLQEKMEELAETAGMSGRSLEMLIDKHDGVIDNVVDELERLQRGSSNDRGENATPVESDGESSDFSPGSMADNQEEDDDDGSDVDVDAEALLLDGDDDVGGTEKEDETSDPPTSGGDLFDGDDDDDDFIFGDE
jgi:hypothetical protein